MSLDNDINQHFQDAIDVIQQHSNNSYYDSGKILSETLYNSLHDNNVESINNYFIYSNLIDFLCTILCLEIYKKCSLFHHLNKAVFSISINVINWLLFDLHRMKADVWNDHFFPFQSVCIMKLWALSTHLCSVKSRAASSHTQLIYQLLYVTGMTQLWVVYRQQKDCTCIRDVRMYKHWGPFWL